MAGDAGQGFKEFVLAAGIPTALNSQGIFSAAPCETVRMLFEFVDELSAECVALSAGAVGTVVVRPADIVPTAWDLRLAGHRTQLVLSERPVYRQERQESVVFTGGYADQMAYDSSWETKVSYEDVQDGWESVVVVRALAPGA